MKESNKRKKVLLTLGCIITLLLLVGISYAYWTKTFFQNEENVVITDCFKIEFTDKNPISFNNAFPLLDEDGLKTVPYTFRIKNACDGSANYQINLETLNPSGKKLPDKYLKVDLNSEKESKRNRINI